MKPTKIKETCLYLKDLETGLAFYNKLLGFPLINYLPEKHLFLRVGESVLLCFNPEDSKLKTSPPAHFANGRQHIAFEVKEEEYQATKTELISKGIVVTDKIIWESGKESFYFEDPEGNVLEILPNEGIWD